MNLSSIIGQPTKPRGAIMPNYDRTIFVFGSNTAGRHGRGAARYALDHYGAIYGVGRGLQGQSYAIPTKDINLKRRSLNKIEGDVKLFNEFARHHSRWLFLLTPIGCGLAGFNREQIKSLLQKFEWPENVVLTMSWLDEDTQ